MKIRKYLSNEKNFKWLVPVVAIVLGFLVGVIIMLVTKRNPLDIFTALFRATLGIDLSKIGTRGTIFNPRYIGEYLVSFMPITLTSLSVGFAFRTGLFNIGAEGQLMAGAFASVATGILLPLPPPFLLIAAIFAGVLAGALWGVVPGYLKARFNVHEVVVTILMNYVALFTMNYFIKLLPGSTTSRSERLIDSALLKSTFLSELTNKSRLHWGILLVILAVFFYWFIIEKTTLGYELRAVGYNPHASKYAGIKINRKIISSMAISGAFAGMAGVVLSLGTFGYGRVLQGFENYGFNGIAVALLGGNSAGGIVFGGFIFGALVSAGPLMQTRNIPRDIAIIIISAIILFMAMQNGIKFVLAKLSPKEEKE